MVPHQKRPAIRSKYMQLKALPNCRLIHFSLVIDRSGALDKHPIREAVWNPISAGIMFWTPHPPPKGHESVNLVGIRNSIVRLEYLGFFGCLLRVMVGDRQTSNNNVNK